jgi:hypothetical protein
LRWEGDSLQIVALYRALIKFDMAFSGLYALCITEQAAIKEGQTIYAFKRELFRLPIPDHLPQLDAFSIAA